MVVVPVLSMCSFLDAEGESLQSLLAEWHNPVFVPCPEVSIASHAKKAVSLAFCYFLTWGLKFQML